jgi:hypothetical protein
VRLEASARQRQPSFIWNGAEIPAQKPAYRSFKIGDDGRIWVQLSTPGVRAEGTEAADDISHARADARPIPAPRWVEPSVWDILEPSGRYIGQVELPRDLTLRAARGDTLWVSKKGTDDVEVIQRMHVVWPK